MAAAAIDFALSKTVRDSAALLDHYYVMNSGEIAALTGQIKASIGKHVTADDVEFETWLLHQAG